MCTAALLGLATTRFYRTVGALALAVLPVFGPVAHAFDLTYCLCAQMLTVEPSCPRQPTLVCTAALLGLATTRFYRTVGALALAVLPVFGPVAHAFDLTYCLCAQMLTVEPSCPRQPTLVCTAALLGLATTRFYRTVGALALAVLPVFGPVAHAFDLTYCLCAQMLTVEPSCPRQPTLVCTAALLGLATTRFYRTVGALALAVCLFLGLSLMPSTSPTVCARRC